jgi:hypothetical protein
VPREYGGAVNGSCPGLRPFKGPVARLRRAGPNPVVVTGVGLGTDGAKVNRDSLKRLLDGAAFFCPESDTLPLPMIEQVC